MRNRASPEFIRPRNCVPMAFTTENPQGSSINGSCLFRLYIERGGDPNQADGDKFTALHFACNAGHRDVVKVLIEHRADVNARSHFQSTPLHFACEHGFVGIVRLLLASGAKVDAQNSDLATPLHFACQKGHIDAAQLLVEATAHVDARTNRGNSPLHYACFFGRYPVVRLLITSGADIGLRNDSGARPGEQFYSKVSKETRAALGRLLRNRSLSPASRAAATRDEDILTEDIPVTPQALRSLVKRLQMEVSTLRKNLSAKNDEIGELRQKLTSFEGVVSEGTGTNG